MKCDLLIEGATELYNALERFGGPSALEKMQERAAARINKQGKPAMEKHVPKSNNNARSGRKSSRPPGHARENIPATVRTRDGETYADIGWRLSDNSKWFYMKFIEWGTYMQPPKPFLEETVEDLGNKPEEIVLDELKESLRAVGIETED